MHHLRLTILPQLNLYPQLRHKKHKRCRSAAHKNPVVNNSDDNDEQDGASVTTNEDPSRESEEVCSPQGKHTSSIDDKGKNTDRNTQNTTMVAGSGRNDVDRGRSDEEEAKRGSKEKESVHGEGLRVEPSTAAYNGFEFEHAADEDIDDMSIKSNRTSAKSPMNRVSKQTRKKAKSEFNELVDGMTLDNMIQNKYIVEHDGGWKCNICTSRGGFFTRVLSYVQAHISSETHKAAVKIALSS